MGNKMAVVSSQRLTRDIQENKDAVRDYIVNHHDAPKTQAIDISLLLPGNATYDDRQKCITKMMDDLAINRDARLGISRTVKHTGDIVHTIRDARNAKGVMPADSVESHLTHMLSLCRASQFIINAHLKRSHGEDNKKFKQYNAQINDAVDFELENLNSYYKKAMENNVIDDAQLQLTSGQLAKKLAHILADAGIKNSKRTLKDAHNHTEAFSQYGHVSTIVKMQDSAGNQRNMADIDTLMIGLTKEQNAMCHKIKKARTSGTIESLKNDPMCKWYYEHSQDSRDLCDLYIDQILDGKFVRSNSQAIGLMPILHNAAVTSAVSFDRNNSLKTLSEQYHSGIPICNAAGVTPDASHQLLRQARLFRGSNGAPFYDVSFIAGSRFNIITPEKGLSRDLQSHINNYKIILRKELINSVRNALGSDEGSVSHTVIKNLMKPPYDSIKEDVYFAAKKALDSCAKTELAKDALELLEESKKCKIGLVKAPSNEFRILQQGGWSMNKQCQPKYQKALSSLGDIGEKFIMRNEFQGIKDNVSHICRYLRNAEKHDISKLTNNLLAIRKVNKDLYNTLNCAVEAKYIIDNPTLKFNINNNTNFFLTSRMEAVSFAVHNPSGCLNGIANNDDKSMIPLLHTHCKSGKDREGAYRFGTAFDAKARELGITADDKQLYKHNMQKQANGCHVQDSAAFCVGANGTLPRSQFSQPKQMRDNALGVCSNTSHNNGVHYQGIGLYKRVDSWVRSARDAMALVMVAGYSYLVNGVNSLLKKHKKEEDLQSQQDKLRDIVSSEKVQDKEAGKSWSDRVSADPRNSSKASDNTTRHR